MSFVRCERPEQSDLALTKLPEIVSGGGGAFEHFAHQVASQKRYWLRQKSTTERDIEVGRYDLASMLSGELTKVDEQAQKWRVTEWKRADAWERTTFAWRGMAAIALSRLTRILLPYRPGEIQDGRVTGWADIVPEMIKKADGSPSDYCLHAPADLAESHFEGDTPATPSQTWYRGKGLYVNRCLPALPEADTLALMQENGIEVDFSSLQTLVPYQERNF